MTHGHAVRGAVLPETALIMTATLALAFGIIQIGVIGYLQIVVDGAAFIAAHEYAIGNTTVSDSTSYLTYAQAAFPLATSTPVIHTLLPDPTTVSVNYNTNLSTQRHGGVSLVLGNHIEATLQRNAPAGLLGIGVASLSSITLQGAAIEPNFGVSNTVYDAEAKGYDTPSALLPYNSNAQNAPANYISQHVMSTCNIPGSKSFGATCPAGNILYRSLGTAEFLDQDNWQRTTLGVGPCPAYTFGEMLYHQEIFADIAAAYFSTPNPTQLPTIPATGGLIAVVNGWDVTQGGYAQPQPGFGLYPLHPDPQCPSGI